MGRRIEIEQKGCGSIMTTTVTFWWPRWGARIYRIVTGVTFRSWLAVDLSSSLCNQLWIWPWIKSLSTEFDITFDVPAKQLFSPIMHCMIDHAVTRFKAWTERLRPNVMLQMLSCLSYFMPSFFDAANKVKYVLPWQTVYVLTGVMFYCVYTPLLLHIMRKWIINIKITQVPLYWLFP